MLKPLLSLILFLPFLISAQNKLEGKILSTNNFTYVLLYKIDNGKPIYLENLKVTNNSFSYQFDENKIPGIYRLYYHLDQGLFIEILYNKEDINLSFVPESPLESLQFEASKENMLYQNFYNQFTQQQRRVDSIQVKIFETGSISSSTQEAYKQAYQKLIAIQEKYKSESKGMLASNLIHVDQTITPEKPLTDPNAYLNYIKKHFFDHIDLSNDILRNSTYINDKIVDYVFYLNQSNDIEQLHKLQKESIETSLEKINQDDFRKNVIEQLIEQYIKLQDGIMVEYVINNHYLNLPPQLQDKAFVIDAQSQVKTAIGQKAPDFSWEENGEITTLYNQTGFDYYTVVFFSSTCNHCQEEMPQLYSFISDFANMKVIAIGLEDEKQGWQDMTARMPQFTHILDLNKWDSPRADAYGVHSIPNYFVLDKDKNIVAKPEELQQYMALFNPE